MIGSVLCALLALTLVVTASSPCRAQSGPSSEDADTSRGSESGGAVVVRFEGGDVNTELALALEVLGDLDLLPTETYAVGVRGPWQAIVEKTQLPADLPPEMQRVLRKLNPDLKSWDKLGSTDRVRFVRSDALSRIPVQRYFNRSQKALERRKTISSNWKGMIVEEKGPSRIDLHGVELKVSAPDEKAARKAVSTILARSRGNAFPSYQSNALPSVGPYYGHISPATYWSDPRHWKMGSKEQAFVGSEVGIDEPPACAQAACDAATCPDVMLVDSAVYRHWDVADAIRDGSQVTDVQASGNSEVVSAAAEVSDPQHGTYMLGLIAARDNDAGLVGVHPGASITTVDWDRYRMAPYRFADLMGTHADEGGDRLEAFVFATSWNLADEFPEWVHGSDTESETLRAKHPVARAIMGDAKDCNGTGALWVVAAGQSETILDPDSRLGKNIVPTRYARGPMNLGDCPNVLVVTACAKCDANDLELVEKVNYSTCSRNQCFKGVHVAARGQDVISTVPVVNPTNTEFEARYARGHGTSPATALTAGVVSAMTSCFPAAFKEPWRVKERVQSTSRPVFGGRHRDRFSAGIVDARMALLDPALTHLADRNGIERAVELLHWCRERVRFVADGDASARALGNVPTSSLLRLSRRQVGVDKWISYSRPEPDTEHRGEVAVHGPSRLEESAAPGGTLIAKVREVAVARGGTWDGTGQAPESVIKLDDVVDLLLQVPPESEVRSCVP